MKYTKLIFLPLAMCIIFNACKNNTEIGTNKEEVSMNENMNQAFLNIGLKTNTDKTLIPLTEILSGGPQKDGIPALRNPKFVLPSQVENLPKETMGVWVKNNSESKFYPYTILVWHEIVNDVVGGTPLAITYCPLCGSAIVFERKVNDTIYEFGVSGKLWQSNMLMYDAETESLWSQIEGRAVVGDLFKTELEIFPSQLLTYKEVLEIDGAVNVLSTDTGYKRNYGVFPYDNYDNTEQLYFPINNPDKKLTAKTLMVAGSINGEAIAFHRANLLAAKAASVETASGRILASVSETNEISFVDEKGKSYPTYITMWFSWANHNQGQIWTGIK